MRRVSSLVSILVLLVGIGAAPAAARGVEWRKDGDPNDASALHKLAIQYANQRKYGEAERLYKRALSSERRSWVRPTRMSPTRSITWA